MNRRRRRLLFLSSVSTLTYNFTTTAPADFSVTRAGSTATYTDSSGKLQQASANTLRIDHDSAGNPLGVLIEAIAATNLCEAANANPVDTTGVSITNGTVALVDDSTALAASNLDGICSSGMVFEFTNTSVTSVITLSGVLNENPNSYRVHARCIGGTGSLDLISGTPTNGSNTVAAAATYTEYTAEGITPGAGRYLRGVLTSGRSMRVILQHVEEDDTLSNIIVNDSSGSTASRAAEEVINNTVDAGLLSAGGVVWVGRAYNVGTEESGLYSLAAGNGAVSNVAVRALSSDGFTDPQIVAGGSGQFSDKIGRPANGELFACGFLWNGTTKTAFASHGMTIDKQTVTAWSTAPDNIRLGRWSQYNGLSKKVHVKEFYTLQGAATLSDASALLSATRGKGTILGGQSNGAYEYKNQVLSTYTNAGEIASIAELDKYYTSGRNFMTNTAVGGARLYENGVGDNNYWIEDDLSHGVLLLRLTETLGGIGTADHIGFKWNQGESSTSDTEQELIDGWQVVITEVRRINATIPIILEISGRRSDNASTDAHYQKMFNAQVALVAANSGVYLSPNTKVLAMAAEDSAAGWVTSTAYAIGDTVTNGGEPYLCKLAHTSSAGDEAGVGASWTTYWINEPVHLSDAAFSEKAVWTARFLADLDGQSVTGPTTGPVVGTVTRSTTAVTVPLTHPTGITDFTPTSAIEGFVFRMGGSAIAQTSVVQADANTITINLDATEVAAGSGVETLEYCYGTGYGLDPAQLVRGNDALNMPLQVFKVTLA